jgi:hypothetical protein
MPDARATRLPLLLAAAIGAAALLWLQPYSVVSPYRAYAEPGRRFLQAALALDTAELSRRSIAPQPVQWALRSGRGDRAALSAWSRLLRPYAGTRHGDTTLVVFQTTTTSCHLRPLAMTFVGSPDRARLLVASSSCFAEP